MRLSIRRYTAIRIIGSVMLGICVVRGAEAVPGRNNAGKRAITGVPQPSPAVQLAMMLQVVKQLEHYVKTKDLSSIHNEDTILSAALSGLLTRADTVVSNRVEQFKADLT